MIVKERAQYCAYGGELKDAASNMLYPAPTMVHGTPSHVAPYPTRIIYYMISFLGIYSLTKRCWNGK
jgi:hypothetical protein